MSGYSYYSSVFCKLKKKIFIAAVTAAFIFGLIAILANTLSSSKTHMVKRSDKQWQSMRLPDDIIPSSYELDLFVDMENDKFNGEVNIEVTISKATSCIILHSVELEISKVEILFNGIKLNIIKRYFSYRENEYFVIETTQTLLKDKNYTIGLNYNGTTRSDLSGLYKSNYEEGNSTYKIAATFFSPISARKAFPCFDEPKFKSKFNLSFRHSDKYHVLSNMPVSFIKKEGSMVHTYFEHTLKMSTYIVCWVVSNYSSIGLETTEHLKIRAWAPYEQLQDTEYGINATSRLLSYYESYFKTKFPLEKLDIVALPNFGPGAMENWGIITYRSTRLLISKGKSTEQERQSTFHIIAHELAHQWFGNLATMKFWTDAWLKEGFANYIGYIGTAEIEPGMEAMKQIFPNLMISSFKLDSYLTSHPISTKAESPDEIREIFDAITYNKGSCMVQMLESYLGKEQFRKGLQQYLTTYAYANADQDDLWEQLSLSSGEDVKSVMDTWTLQLGFPVITIKRINDQFVQISQERFSLDAEDDEKKPSPFNYIWKVPIIYKNTNGAIGKYLLTTKQATTKFPVDAILNPNHVMYYKTNYDPQTLSNIKKKLGLNHNQFSVQDRTGIISDQFSMASTGLNTIKEAFDIIDYIKKENDYYPWSVAMEEVLYMYYIKQEGENKERLRYYIRNLTSERIINVGWAKVDSVNEGLLQGLMLKIACESGNQQVIKQAILYFREWMSGNLTMVQPDLLPIVRQCAIANGPNLFWEHNFQQYLKGGSQKTSLLVSLTFTKNKLLLQRLINYTLNTDIIESQDSPYLLGNIATNSNLGRELVWKFVKEKFDGLIKIYGSELFLLGRMFTSVISNFYTEHELDDVEKFFANVKNLGTGKQAVKQSIQKIKSNIQWKKKNEDQLDKWLEELLPSNTR